jgi:hypothetical protein
MPNGLSKLRGRLKQLSYQTAKEASRNKFVYIFKQTNCIGLLVPTRRD